MPVAGVEAEISLVGRCALHLMARCHRAKMVGQPRAPGAAAPHFKLRRRGNGTRWQSIEGINDS